LPPFSAAAAARLVEFGGRLINDRRKLPSQWDQVADVMREAAFWCRKAGQELVDEAHVQLALEQRIFRLNRYEEKLREFIRDGTLLVDLDGRKAGQVNGLAVANIGGYEFGRPSRVTAAVSMGTQGIINVEREAQLSGHTHDKGVLIISGYLRRTYAQDFPLSLSASLCFEQSYGGIDGDSASSTELFALISSLSGVPLRQDLGVTGSVNQWGEIQPIGGINEKIEGFFATCVEVGFTGQQGVVMPVQNLHNLVLRPQVIEAIGKGQFHLYPIRTIDEGLEVLTGVKAGSVHEEGTIHYLASQRLRRLAEGLRHFAATPAGAHGQAHRRLRPSPLHAPHVRTKHPREPFRIGRTGWGAAREAAVPPPFYSLPACAGPYQCADPVRTNGGDGTPEPDSTWIRSLTLTPLPLNSVRQLSARTIALKLRLHRSTSAP
jgi:ATP-dependent Lon protease